MKGIIIRKSLAARCLALLLGLLMCCPSAWAEGAETGRYAYEHDPRENPVAMRDIVENPEAVYGFSPSTAEGSTLKEYADALDWTDAGQVAAARAQRQAYHDSMEELYDMIVSMVSEGQEIETIARAVSQRRNELRLEAYADDPEGLDTVKKRNLETYGNEFGPTQDALYEKYGSWETVLLKALGTNPGMDACLGFYDEYYDLYEIEDAAESKVNISDNYTLEQVVVLSRHNLRAPLSSNGSVPNELTPHSWIEWSAGSSELTLLGGLEETSMGQYFRKWLASEGLIPENSIPAEGEVRFNARDKQRCRATAHYFAAGMLPLADIEVEYPGDAKGTEDFMQPILHFYSEDYAADATAQVASMGGEAGFDGLADQTRDVIRLIMDTVDMQESEAYKSGKYGDLLTDSFGYIMEAGKEPDLAGAIKPAYQVADALILQYYEEPDDLRAAFGHELTDEDWATLGAFMTTCLEMKHGAPLVAANITNPLLRELKAELQNEQRKFSFFCAHDCTVLGTLSALGAEDFALPDSIETKTPVGVKLMFERWRDAEGKAWYRVSLLYRSTEQIRSGEMLTMDNPPLRYDLRFDGVGTNTDGLIAEDDLIDLFDRSIDVLADLEDTYSSGAGTAEELGAAA